MSELIRNEDMQAKLRKIVERLHRGSEVKAVKRDFDRMIRHVSAEEIAALEQSLIDGGVPAEQVQELCDVHVAVFKSALERDKSGVLPGHPVHTYRAENRVAKQKARVLKRAARRARKDRASYEHALEDLRAIEVHYQRKENQLFPFLESVGFTGPSKVMWGKHDEIRESLKRAQDDPRAARDVAGAVRRMIFMEERILFPTALRKLTDRAWAEVRRGEPEIGYAWITPGDLWDANLAGSVSPRTTGEAQSVPDAAVIQEGDTKNIALEVGELSNEQLDLMLTTIPLDLTFVDERDKVRYYSGGKERLFPRSPGIIGRDVANCHPPKSVHIVERIVSSFRKGERKCAEFYFTLNERFIHVRYFAVYNEFGNYRGTVEMSQDITDIKNLSGEKKLLDWD